MLHIYLSVEISTLTKYPLSSGLGAMGLIGPLRKGEFIWFWFPYCGYILSKMLDCVCVGAKGDGGGTTGLKGGGRGVTKGTGGGGGVTMGAGGM